MNTDTYREMQERMGADLRKTFEQNVKACGVDCELIKAAQSMVEDDLTNYSRRDLERFVKRVASHDHA